MRAEPLNAEAFAPFGTLIRHGGGEGRHYLPGILASTVDAPRPAVWVNRLQPVRWPLVVTRLERHPKSAQSFVPLGVGRILTIVCAAGPDGLPDSRGVRAFLVPDGTGIAYHPGVWRHGLACLGPPMEVLVLFAAQGTARETDYADFPIPVSIQELLVP